MMADICIEHALNPYHKKLNLKNEKVSTVTSRIVGEEKCVGSTLFAPFIQSSSDVSGFISDDFIETGKSFIFYFNDRSSFMKFEDEIKRRIAELEKIASEVDEINLMDQSKKAMLGFLREFSFEYMPEISYDENGIFHISWRNSKNNALHLSFETNDTVDFVFITPSNTIGKKRDFTSGNVSRRDLIRKINQNNIIAQKVL